MIHQRFRHLLFLILATALALSALAARPKRTSKGVRSEKQRTEQRIRLTQDQIRENKRKTTANLNKLNALDADIDRQRKLIGAMNDSIRSAESEIKIVRDSITSLERDVDIIRRSYANALRTARSRRRGADDMAFIFSAGTFAQSMSRYRYLQTFSRWLSAKSVSLKASVDRLAAKKLRLDTLRASRVAALGRLNSANEMLLAQQAATKVIVDQLQSDKSTLNALLKEQQNQMRELDRELDRLIAEEMRKAQEEEERRRREQALREQQEREARERQEQAQKKTKPTEKKGSKKKNKPETQQPTKKTPAPVSPPANSATDVRLAADFASNRGKLPAPVSGHYRIVKPFGVTKHPSLPNVLVENSGIDLQVDGNATANAVFDGVVSVIFRPSGYQTVVVVRHGDYLTVYGNLDAINVSKGDRVKRGQPIGHIYANPADGGAGILHFEVRKGREKLNPAQWIR